MWEWYFGGVSTRHENHYGNNLEFLLHKNHKHPYTMGIMSAEISRLREDILDPDSWHEHTVLTVSVSPWYRVPNGGRVRTVNMIHGNHVEWEEVRKGKEEAWSKAQDRTTSVVRKMLKSLDTNLHELVV